MSEKPSKRAALTPERLWRMQEIDRLLSSGGRYSNAELQEKLERGEHTIIRDVRELRNLGAPIPDQDPRGYWYTKPWRMPRVLELTEGELLAFFVAERVVEGFGPDNPYARKLKKGIREISRGLAHKMPVAVDHLMRRGFRFDAGPVREVDPAVIDAVETGLTDLVSLEITYRTLSRENRVSTRKVDPYFLHNYRGDWYLVAHCHKRGGPTNFALSRLQQARVLEAETFTVPKDFDAQGFFGDTWGVYRGRKAQLCRIWFSAEAGRWIRERHWHDSQEIQELEDGSIVLSMTVMPTLEVVRWILAHGPEARALAPEGLVADVRRQVEAAYANLDAPPPAGA